MAEVGDASETKVACMNSVTSFDLAGRVPIVLAATGHRVIPKQDEEALCRAVNSELNLIAKSNPHSPCILISALAEGADRLVASCALSLGWQLCAVLPLTQDDYETDFHDDESVAEFRELLKRSTLVKVLDAKHHLRPGCYHELGLWLSQQAQVLIALWDGEQAKGPGGTAEVIQHFREGVALAQPILPDSGPVIHIQTRQTLLQQASADFEVGRVRMLPASPGGLPSDGEANRWRVVLSRIDKFNKDSIDAQRVDGQLTATWGLPFPQWASTHLAGSKVELARHLFLSADALSISAQKERDRMFMGLLGFSAVAILLSQVYSSLFSIATLLACAVGLIGVGACWYWAASQRNLEGRYLDYRALAEACRVQYFWKIVGIGECASVHFLREQRDELEWIRQAIQTSEIGDEEAKDAPLLDRLMFVRTAWIDDQLKYFGGANGRIGKAALNHLNDVKWSQRSRLLFVLGMTLTLMTAIFHVFFADTTVPLHDWAQRSMIVGYSILFASSGLVKVYQETRAFAEHAKLYQRMDLALQLTRSRLDAALACGDLERAVEIVRSLGIEALAENGNWLLMHRERPVLVQGIG